MSALSFARAVSLRPAAATRAPGRTQARAPAVVARAARSSRRDLLVGVGSIAGLLLKEGPANAFGLPGSGPPKEKYVSDYDKMMADIAKRNAETGESMKSAEDSYSACPEGYEYLVKKSNPLTKCVEINGSGDGSEVAANPPVAGFVMKEAPPSLEDVFSGKAEVAQLDFVVVEGYKSTVIDDQDR